MGCTCEDFEENWARYNGAALYVSLNWVMVIICSGNGLLPVYWQPIAWLNTNQLVTGPKRTKNEIESKWHGSQDNAFENGVYRLKAIWHGPYV